MRAPRHSLPWRVLVGLGLFVGAVKACVAVARAAEPLGPEMISGIDAIGGGMAGAFASLLVLVLTLWRLGLLPSKAEAQAHQAAEMERRRTERERTDDEPSVATVAAAFILRDEAERKIADAERRVRAEADGQHERVRSTLREHERRQIAIEERSQRLEVEVARKLAAIEGKLDHLSAMVASLSRG